MEYVVPILDHHLDKDCDILEKLEWRSARFTIQIQGNMSTFIWAALLICCQNSQRLEWECMNVNVNLYGTLSLRNF